MALIKCVDCGAEFSERANACPKCGGPNENLAITKQIYTTDSTPNSQQDSAKVAPCGRLVLRRQKCYRCSLAAFEILIDRELVGRIKNGRGVVISDLSVGKHELVFDHPMTRAVGGSLHEVGRKGAGGKSFEIHPLKTTEIIFKYGWTGLIYLSSRVY
jgi:hypothetical protein